MLLYVMPELNPKKNETKQRDTKTMVYLITCFNFMLASSCNSATRALTSANSKKEAIIRSRLGRSDGSGRTNQTGQTAANTYEGMWGRGGESAANKQTTIYSFYTLVRVPYKARSSIKRKSSTL